MANKIPIALERIGIRTSKEFATKIKDFRRTRSMTYADLANFIGVTVITVYMWEKRERMPNNKLIIQKLIEEGILSPFNA